MLVKDVFFIILNKPLIQKNCFKYYINMDTQSLSKVTSLFILTLIQRDDGQKKQALEKRTANTGF